MIRSSKVPNVLFNLQTPRRSEGREDAESPRWASLEENGIVRQIAFLAAYLLHLRDLILTGSFWWNCGSVHRSQGSLAREGRSDRPITDWCRCGTVGITRGQNFQNAPLSPIESQYAISWPVDGIWYSRVARPFEIGVTTSIILSTVSASPESSGWDLCHSCK